MVTPGSICNYLMDGFKRVVFKVWIKNGFHWIGSFHLDTDASLSKLVQRNSSWLTLPIEKGGMWM
jgi:hypothetical protein